MIYKIIYFLNRYNDDTQIFLPIEPWSCCRLDYPICYHDAMQMSGSIDNTEKLKSINLIGCMKKIMDPLQNGFIFFILVSYSTLFLQVGKSRLIVIKMQNFN